MTFVVVTGKSASDCALLCVVFFVKNAGFLRFYVFFGFVLN